MAAEIPATLWYRDEDAMSTLYFQRVILPMRIMVAALIVTVICLLGDVAIPGEPTPLAFVSIGTFLVVGLSAMAAFEGWNRAPRTARGLYKAKRTRR